MPTWMMSLSAVAAPVHLMMTAPESVAVGLAAKVPSCTAPNVARPLRSCVAAPVRTIVNSARQFCAFGAAVVGLIVTTVAPKLNVTVLTFALPAVGPQTVMASVGFRAHNRMGYVDISHGQTPLGSTGLETGTHGEGRRRWRAARGHAGHVG